MNYPFEKAVASPDETKELAAAFAKQINAGLPVVLNGELGSGKTFFVKHVSSVWGIKNAGSPSFSIVNSYKNGKTVFHFDFYRIKNKEELLEIGFNDYLNDSEAIVFIEWGNLIPEVLPKRRIEISIEIQEDTKRYFRFNKYE